MQLEVGIELNYPNHYIPRHVRHGDNSPTTANFEKEPQHWGWHVENPATFPGQSKLQTSKLDQSPEWPPLEEDRRFSYVPWLRSSPPLSREPLTPLLSRSPTLANVRPSHGAQLLALVPLPPPTGSPCATSPSTTFYSIPPTYRPVSHESPRALERYEPSPVGATMAAAAYPSSPPQGPANRTCRRGRRKLARNSCSSPRP